MKLAALGAPEDYALLARLAEATSAFFFPQLPRTNRLAGCSIVLSAYRRFRGSPLEAASDLLREFCELVPEG